MAKLIPRIARVAGRIARPLAQLRSTGRLILATLGVFGVGVVGRNWPVVKAWLFSEWTHWGFVGFGILFLSAFVAMCGMEREFDALRNVKAAALERMCLAEFYPERKIRHELERNLLFVRVVVSFRNNEPQVIKVKVPTPILVTVRRGWRRYRMEMQVFGQSDFRVGTYPRIGDFAPKLWHELPAKEEKIHHVSYWCPLPEPGAHFIGRPLKVRLEFKLIGHPDLDIVIKLPAIRPAPEVPTRSEVTA